MKIEITSSSINSDQLYRSLSTIKHKYEFKLEELPKGSRPIATSLLIVVIPAAITAISTLTVTIINAVKEVKLAQLEIESKSRQNDHEKEVIKIENQELRKNSILKGNIDLILKSNVKSNELKSAVANIGGVLDSDSILIPMNIVEEDLIILDDILELKDVKEILHRD